MEQGAKMWPDNCSSYVPPRSFLQQHFVIYSWFQTIKIKKASLSLILHHENIATTTCKIQFHRKSNCKAFFQSLTSNDFSGIIIFLARKCFFFLWLSHNCYRFEFAWTFGCGWGNTYWNESNDVMSGVCRAKGSASCPGTILQRSWSSSRWL